MSAPPAPTPPQNATAGALMRWSVGVVNSHRSAPLRALLTADTLDRFPIGTYRGADEIAGFYDTLFAAFPDVTLTILSLLDDGDHAMLRWRMTATHTGADFQGLAATGARIDVDGTDDAVFSAGRMVSNFVVFDQTQLARQIGLMPPQGSRAEVGLKRAVNLRTRLRRRAGH